MRTTVICVTTLRSLVEVGRRFRGAHCLPQQDDVTHWLDKEGSTSVNFYETTRRYTPKGCHLNIRRREKFKSRVA
jgi:hypothetical protein